MEKKSQAELCGKFNDTKRGANFVKQKYWKVMRTLKDEAGDGVGWEIFSQKSCYQRKII